jgi:hypothetical protein
MLVPPLFLNSIKSKYGRGLHNLVPTPTIYVDAAIYDDIINNTLLNNVSGGLQNTVKPRAKTRISGVTTNYTGSIAYNDNVGSLIINSNYFYQAGQTDLTIKYDALSFSIWIKPYAIINNASTLQCPLQLFYSVNTEGVYYIGLGSATGLLTNEYITMVYTGLNTEGGIQSTKRTAVADGGNLAANTWVMLTFNWNAAESRYDIYKNVVKYPTLIASTVATGGHVPVLKSDVYPTGADDLILGALTGDVSPNDGRIFFNGEIGLFVNYSRSLSDAEITQNYNETKTRFI